jgi:Type II secretory pathway, component PulF
MALFLYKAVNATGGFSEGKMEAADSKVVSFRLQGMGLIPYSINEASAPGAGGILQNIHFQRISGKDILFFTEELSTLIHAGLPLDRSLAITAELAAKPALRAIVNNVLKEIKGGKSLAEALALHPKQFSRLYVNMIRAGEAGGVLDVILARLVEFERSADELRSYLITALIYPALLVAVGLTSVSALLFYVIPRFATIFEDMGAAIPPATAVLLSISTLTRAYWWVVLLVIGVSVFAMRSWLATPKGSRTWDALKLKVPFLGPTILKMEVARFARTLGTLITSSVPLIGGIRIVQDIVTNQILSEAISKIASGAKRGEGVSRPMRDTGVFPGLAVHLIEVGEETGRLDSMLLQIADVYDKDVRTSVKALTAILEPLIILVMGVLVGAVILSMLMAIFSIYEVGF